MYLLVLLILILPFHDSLLATAESRLFDEKILQQEEEKLNAVFLEYAKFYELPTGVDLWEITEDLLNSSIISEPCKQMAQHTERRFFVFTYPSDGLQIKCIVSFIPNPHEHRTLILLRGGTQFFGLLNPANDLICTGPYTALAPAYRGGVSEGKDEYGGNDVNDVKHLIDFIPELEKKLNASIQNENMYLVGTSRGGLQMFLTLARFPELQTRFNKIVSLSGLLDLRQCMRIRPDMREMFIQEFGLIEAINEEEWINSRDPILATPKIRPDLPILIIQGTEDNRTSLEEGYHMVETLHALGCQVTYWEIEGAEHCLKNIKGRADLIFDWLEE